MHVWAVAKLKPKANDTASERQILQGFRTLILGFDFTPASDGSKDFSQAARCDLKKEFLLINIHLTVTLSDVKKCLVTKEYSLEELAEAVQYWCEENRVIPANGQAAEEITERNIRYYRTLGLLDPPIGNYAKTFSEKHRLQLIAIRVFQAQGLPLRKIRDELYGKSVEDLTELAKQVSKRGGKALSLTVPFLPPAASESWSVVPLTGEFLLISRNNQQLPRGVIEKINQLLHSACPQEIPSESNKN